MKKLLFCTVCLLCFLPVAAQDAQTLKEAEAPVVSADQGPQLKSDPVFQKKGFEKYCRWVLANVEYPSEMQSRKIGGTVELRIIVETDGSVTVDKVLRSPGKAFTEAVEAAVAKSPKWTPGTALDEATGQVMPIRVAYTMPIEFKVRQDLPTDMKGQFQRINTNIRTYGSSD